VSASYIDVTVPGGSRVQEPLPGEPTEPQWSDPPQPTIDPEAEIARLKVLSKLGYEQQREPAAKKLGMRVSVLDELVDEKRSGKGGTSNAQGRALNLHEPEPWPETVDGAELLDALSGAIRRHVVLRVTEADALALWVVGVHAFGAWRIFPRVFLTAPDKRCGKTTLIEVLSCLVPRPLPADSITVAAIFRVIEATRPTLLLDEADHYCRNNEEMRAVVNSGHSPAGRGDPKCPCRRRLGTARLFDLGTNGACRDRTPLGDRRGSQHYSPVGNISDSWCSEE
jgi:hypothetical protein